MVVLPQMTADESAMAAERWRVRVGKHQFAGVGRLSCCFGVAESIPGDTPELLTARADQALYHAKDNGRNRVSGHGQVASA
jgi:PleD family two-component response regulator